MKNIRIRTNVHYRDFEGQCNFTIELNVKNADWSGISDETGEYESVTGEFTNKYSQKCFDSIMKRLKGASRTWQILDWSFAGRTNGWFVLLCNGAIDCITRRQEEIIEQEVQQFFNEFNQNLLEHYGERGCE